MRNYKISATSYYNLSRCHRRVYLDLYGNPEERGEYSDFLQLLWEKGIQIEKEILEKIKRNRAVDEVTGYPDQNTFSETIKLMSAGSPLIYQGVLIDEDKVGRPDLLERVEGSSKFGTYHYIPCDIKSGRATEKKDGEDIKAHYADQVLFYGNLLEKIQGIKPTIGKLIDIEGVETNFRLEEYDPDYKQNTLIINSIAYDKKEPELQIGGTCKECVWCNHCLKLAKEKRDPTLLFKLGKQKFALRDRGIRTIEDVSQINIAEFLLPQNKIPRAGEKTLNQWKRRALVWIDNKPVLRNRPSFKAANREIYYDIEDDPSIDNVYLHGIIEIKNGKKDSYMNFCAWDRYEEEKAARLMWEYIESLSDDDVIYHYGSYEKTKLKRLKEKYNLPEGPLEKFDRLRVDLYREIEKSSDWPAYSYGIKSIAKILNFKWTTEDASGANSIVWYNDYRKNPESRKDLLDKISTYNKEDCEAMIVVKNWLSK